MESNLNNYKVNHPKSTLDVADRVFRLEGKDCKIPLRIDLEKYAGVYRDKIVNNY